MRLDTQHLDVIRAANGAVRTAAAADGGARSYLCECGDLACARELLLAPSEYDERRLAPDPRVVHPLCAAREERRALLAEHRVLRATMLARREQAARGLERLRRLLGM